ncbi:MAG: lysine--tRNA ligase [Eubacterium sp.]|nr:lysine--tRNA ligase [Eubacterium sp.]
MHWSEEIARKIIEQKPDKEEYVCATGISPSGSIHIGNFRDIATSYFVVLALRKLGKKARLMHSWDELDRLRKIPVNVANVNPDMEKYIGYPYVDVPDPFTNDSESSYAKYFEQEFMQSIQKFGIEIDYRYQAAMYRAGKYTAYIKQALQERHKIFDILDSFRTQEAKPGERENYYPVSIYCSKCGKDTTKIISFHEEDLTAEYECTCGHKDHFDFNTNFNCKLAWKIDWPMRWLYEDVDFEPGGKDHAAPGGSYDTSSVISREIFHHEPPVFQAYEFIGLRGATGKMSGSTGLNLTPETLLKIYQPEMILWLYSRAEPTRSFDFCFDDGILKQYFEFDKMYDQYQSGSADDRTNAIMHNCQVAGHTISTVPMGLLVQLGSVVNFNPQVLETVFEKIGTPYKEHDFSERLELAKNWLELCSPENVNRLCQHRNWDVYETFSEEEKLEIKNLYEYLLEGNYNLEELNQKIYAIPVDVYNLEDTGKERKKLQGTFFQNVYKLLIGKEKGPRLYLFLYAIEKDQYLPLLDFSYPKTEEEIQFEEEAKKAAAEQEAAKAEKKVHKAKIREGEEADPVQPLKEQISLDLFQKMDLRVCEIIKCQEIRKSNRCYKITLNDGLGERVIVSSIKDEYEPEELIGRKIVVIVNLEPTRISGVTSHGMLLAATNSICGCELLFVDECVPNGTAIS